MTGQERGGATSIDAIREHVHIYGHPNDAKYEQVFELCDIEKSLLSEVERLRAQLADRDAQIERPKITWACGPTCGPAEGGLPATLEEAHIWIRSLQRVYHSELHHRERLSQRLHDQHELVYRALQWRRARGMHIKPALSWLRGVTDQLLEKIRSGEYSEFG